jgi:SAM-dependent methyltransferase
MKSAYDFYNTIERQNTYTTCNRAEDHPAYPILLSFIEKNNLHNKKCLEIGSSKGLFQDLVNDYTGIDVGENLKQHYQKKYIAVKSGEKYPFEDQCFDAIWSWAVHEHIVDLDESLTELVRVLKIGGVVLFSPAWQCRSWAAQGYTVRPYSDFNLIGKFIKVTIPIRNSIIWRSLSVFPKRILRHFYFIAGFKPAKIHYNKLEANYEHYWVTDGDACNHIDPHDAILWFETHGFKCISHPLHFKALSVRTGPLILKRIYQ